MTNAIQLLGTFILTLVGFVVPILTILVSIFPEGVKALAQKYENEKKQTDDNIRSETTKKETAKEINYLALEKTLKTLKKKKREAEFKLGYLKPYRFLVRTSTPFIVALVGILVSLFENSTVSIIFIIIFSFCSIIAGVISLFASISVIFEVAEIVNEKKNNNEEKLISLLSTLVEKAGEDPYLKADQIEVFFHKKPLKKDIRFDFSVDKKYDVDISIHNKSDKMAKNVETGFCFPKNIVIEKAANFEITTTEDEQIVRFKEDGIQAHNDNRQGKIALTFLEAKPIKIDVFVKGENVKYYRFPIHFNIIK